MPQDIVADENLVKPKEGCARLLKFTAPQHTGVHQINEPAYRRVKSEATSGSAPAKADEIDNKAWFPARTVFDDSIAVRRRIDSDLSFESRFESGNLQKAVRTGEFEYNLTLRADVNTGKAQWYYFLVQRMQKGFQYRFNIINFYKDKSTYNIGLQPLLWSSEDANQNNLGWRRSGSDISYYENGLKQENGANFFTLSFKMSFPHANDTCYVSMCYPYTYTDLQKYLRWLERNPSPSKFLSRSELCKTLAGNICDLLQITSPDSHTAIKSRKAFVFTSRVHPGETNASFIMKGVLDFLLSSDQIAVALRKHFVFYVVPMLNPDGVINGFYRGSLSGDDLNRQWSDPNKKQHSTIYHCKQLIKKLVKDERLLLFCDFHGHSTKRNAFMYGCSTVESGSPLFVTKDMPRKETEFPKLFSKRCPSFSYKDCKFEADRGKDTSGRVIIFREFGIVHSFTLEASLFGRELDGCLTHFSQKDFEDIGSEFCRCLADYCTQNESWGLGDATISGLQAALKNDHSGPGAGVLDSYLKSLKLMKDKRISGEVSELFSSNYVINQIQQSMEQRVNGKDKQFKPLEQSGSNGASVSLNRPTPNIDSLDSYALNRSNSEELDYMLRGNSSPNFCVDSLVKDASSFRFGPNMLRDAGASLASSSRSSRLCSSIAFDAIMTNCARVGQSQSADNASQLKQFLRPEVKYQIWRSLRTTQRAATLSILTGLGTDSKDLVAHNAEQVACPPTSEDCMIGNGDSTPRNAHDNDSRQSTPNNCVPSQMANTVDRQSDVKGTLVELSKAWQSSAARCESPWRGCLPIDSDGVSLGAVSPATDIASTKQNCILGCTVSGSRSGEVMASASATSCSVAPQNFTVWPHCSLKDEQSNQKRVGMSLTQRRRIRESERDDIGIQKGLLISFLRRRK